MVNASKKAAFKTVIPRAAVLRAVSERISSEPIVSRYLLGNYYVSKFALLDGEALILTGFDLDGNILCEKIIRGKPMTTPRAARERIAEFADTRCQYFGAGRRFEGKPEEYRPAASDECEAIFKILFENGSILKEYVMVDGFAFTLMSGKSRTKFPLNEKP